MRIFKRCELHNHTTESDAQLSCAELIELMEREGVDIFALTDHNTVSGHRIIRGLLSETQHTVRCVYGMEYTTYYGHILCLNLERYVPWDSIDRNRPELLFEALRAAGAVVGIAHPFAFGDPFARGCRFEMRVTDYSSVDFIEVINNHESLREVNAHSLNMWEELCLSGWRIAATAGMDLHRDSGFAGSFATYIEGSEDGDPGAEAASAVSCGRTWVSNGMVLLVEKTENGLLVCMKDMHKPGFVPADGYVMTLRSESGTRTYELSDGERLIPWNELPEGGVLIPKLYGGDPQLENLICISPVIRL